MNLQCCTREYRQALSVLSHPLTISKLKSEVIQQVFNKYLLNKVSCERFDPQTMTAKENCGRILGNDMLTLGQKSDVIKKTHLV